MSSRVIAIIGAVAISAITSHASWDEPAGVFFARDRGQVAPQFGAMPKRITRSNDLPIILSVTRKMGIPDDLAQRVCHVESRCRVNGPAGPMTKHGRHVGAFQTRANVAARFGYTPAEGPLVGMVALKYGAAHLADCWRRSGRNTSLAARCHLGGPGVLAGKRVSPGAQAYLDNYDRWVRTAPLWQGPMPQSVNGFRVAMK